MSSFNDTRYLEQHGGKWRVTLAVPKDLRPKFGTRLKRSLYTDSLSLANRRKWAVIAELQRKMDVARRAARGKRDALLLEAAEHNKWFRELDDEARYQHRNDLVLKWYELAAPSERTEHTDDGPVPVWEGEAKRLADDYVGVVDGTKLPLRLFYNEYLETIKTAVKPRTLADDRRAIEYLERWCELENVEQDLRAITTSVAKRFVSQMHRVAGDIVPRTQKKYLGRLKLYFDHIVYFEHLPANPWASVVLKVPETPHEEEERAFTDEEIRRLLIGPASTTMADLMRFGALTGARLDAIVCLRVGDTRDGALTFKAQKREKTTRDIPTHPDLLPIIERRSAGRSADDYLFPEYPAPKENSHREKSFKASNAFTEYRRQCGVDERVDGKRRALVNFHSFRRWFVTKAERAGFPEPLIAAIVGHKREGITLGRYSEGPDWKRAKRCISAVKLPPLDHGPITEERSLTPRHR